ncbi:MAG TPA: hypothetical protein VKR55_29545 [Bradyrhizobium sp.]|uniref:hypothetical protein n=1 Tax=Bradyrhizobium sp. TaxID=376 RepID=UPI002BB26BA3|nr:hypothetical protein [Bradyrhizobium sp.]HLZ06283.1 hypothetical protein [Bradyrhizobium sp.]
MAQPLPTLKPDFASSRRGDGVRSALIWGGTGLSAALLAAAAVLWFRYGTAVFFEIIAAGFANCF